MESLIKKEEFFVQFEKKILKYLNYYKKLAKIFPLPPSKVSNVMLNFRPIIYQEPKYT